MSMRMDEDSLSMTSNAGSAIIRKRTYHAEAPVSTFTDFFFQGSKRLSPESTSVCASNKRKGVVLQQNGHWGAQIYANHNRIWLGTFNSEKEAAMAYDSAAIKLRNGECHMNFGWTVETDREFHFQSFYSQEEILRMIKDRSYQSRLESFWEAKTAERWRNIRAMPQQTRRDPSKKQLFQKELKPSDVGKLNRLVIPKNYATKYFPRIDETAQGGLKDNPAPDVQLSFFDEKMRPWKFRYCYWKSSQSFVFTKGWNRFVKERLLKANDTIRFFECHTMEGDKAAQIFYMIEVDKAENSHGIVDNASQSVSLSLTSFNDKKFEEERDHLKSQTAEVIDVTPEVDEDSRRFRLFGVNIHVDED